MDKNLLKLDYDTRFVGKVVRILSERLSYAHDLGFFYFENIEYIKLEKKTGWNARIKLKHDYPEHFIMWFQTILGSDWMKEINTYMNHYKFGMEYSNRLFQTKRYKGGKILTAKTMDVTDIIRRKVMDKKRIKYHS